MYRELSIQCHKGFYKATFRKGAFDSLNEKTLEKKRFIIDKKVADIYSRKLRDILDAPSTLRIEATENNKTLKEFTEYVEHLVSHGIRREDTLVAIGGGIIQDITCFLASTLLRGIKWSFYPTTLLAQADSCIGSKSSVNVGKVKNILGTFNPPELITIDTDFLSTLEERDIQSGIGEMLKVHAIEGPDSFDRISKDYERLSTGSEIMTDYIFRSLEIKKRIIEEDEFDKGARNVMNYGHSFGHAIESATSFGIPHGVAVTIGMDMANYTAVALGLTHSDHYNRMHTALASNFSDFINTEIDTAAFLNAISKDKKNIDTRLRLALPDSQGRISVGLFENNQKFVEICANYLEKDRYK
ncbi:3-dehydroquinate synthase [Candidatus Desulfarcum epimagneticum]|uniref:3-dehydroquinate synthase n=1 Tax=uncultured Desulfobacteraceae bacterium TaxID=218296 RepID=A0A484HGU7_9BACT|nr:3-dehydroquinate synthase [uncultured Desulfobacteraceae bacterium]